MKHPKISVITPSYNQGRFIEETIRSVLSQNYPYLEYIIIDGGSKDNTVEIIKKYQSQIAYWISEKDNGQSEAINKGFKKATGDVVCWINSDDLLLPGSLQKVSDLFSNDKSLDFVTGYTTLIDENSNILFNYFNLKPKKWLAHQGIYYYAQPSMFWRRSVIERIGYLREDFHAQMDKELLIRIFESRCKCKHVSKTLSAFRIHGSSKTVLQGEIWKNDSEKLQMIYGGRYPSKENFIYRIIYGFGKLIYGLYIKDWLFRAKWKGKNIMELNRRNCVYLK